MLFKLLSQKLDQDQRDQFCPINKKKCEKESESSIINNDAYPNYTDYDFPVVVQNFGTVPTMGEKNVYDGLYVSKSASMDIENKTLYM